MNIGYFSMSLIHRPAVVHVTVRIKRYRLFIFWPTLHYRKLNSFHMQSNSVTVWLFARWFILKYHTSRKKYGFMLDQYCILWREVSTLYWGVKLYFRNIVKKYLAIVRPIKPLLVFYWKYFQYKSNIWEIFEFHSKYICVLKHQYFRNIGFKLTLFPANIYLLPGLILNDPKLHCWTFCFLVNFHRIYMLDLHVSYT